MGRKDKIQERFDRRKAAAAKAAEQDRKAKEALAAKQARHSPGKLTRAERKLAKRMGEKEGEKKS